MFPDEAHIFLDFLIRNHPKINLEQIPLNRFPTVDGCEILHQLITPFYPIIL